MTDATHTSTLIGIHIKREVVARSRNESPVRLMAASNQEFISRAAKMRSYGIGPFCTSMLLHLQIDIISIESPALMN